MNTPVGTILDGLIWTEYDEPPVKPWVVIREERDADG